VTKPDGYLCRKFKLFAKYVPGVVLKHCC